MVDVLLRCRRRAARRSSRATRAHGGDVVDTTELLVDIRALVAGQAPVAAAPRASAGRRAAAPARHAAGSASRRPARASSSCGSARSTDRRSADNLVELFKEIDGLGTIEPLDGGHAGRRHAPLQGADDAAPTTTCSTCSPSTWRASRSSCCRSARATASTPARRARRRTRAPRRRLRLLRRRTGCAPAAAGAAAPQPPRCERPTRRPRPRPAAAPRSRARPPAAALEAATLRVSVEKVDQLINLVGELVITQAMLAQNSKSARPALHQQLAAGPGRPRAQHARPAGSGDVDPHDADVVRVQPLPAHAARPGRQARQEGRAASRRARRPSSTRA